MTFRVGDRVRVSDRAHEGHHRTPGYVKGRQGRVERVWGRFTNPETRAYGSDGLPELVLYQVVFDLEPARTYVDVFEHWLEEAR
ncbi:MAG TPA: SH3-like domain-containing protein [Gaiellaceae bacterium]